MATNGLVVMTPTSIAYSGTSASINGDGSVDFSAVTSLSLNGVFTADYDNYMVAIRHVGTAEVGIAMRMRASGSDESSASNYYTYQMLSADSTSVSGSRTASNLGVLGITSTSQRSGDATNIYGPYLAQPTAWRTVSARGFNDAAVFDYANTHSLSTSYDGFTCYPTSGNFTGLLTVFGFNQ